MKEQETASGRVDMAVGKYAQKTAKNKPSIFWFCLMQICIAIQLLHAQYVIIESSPR